MNQPRQPPASAPAACPTGASCPAGRDPRIQRGVISPNAATESKPAACRGAGRKQPPAPARSEHRLRAPRAAVARAGSIPRAQPWARLVGAAPAWAPTSEPSPSTGFLVCLWKTQLQITAPPILMVTTLLRDKSPHPISQVRKPSAPG